MLKSPNFIYFHRFLSLFCLLALLLPFAACTKKGESRSIEPTEAFGMLRNRFAILLDVREKEELTDGMAEGAVWMPMSMIRKAGNEWSEFVQNKLTKDKTIIIYCAVGGRAGEVAEILNEKGFKTGNMGGFKDWVAAKLPTQPSVAQ